MLVSAQVDFSLSLSIGRGGNDADIRPKFFKTKLNTLADFVSDKIVGGDNSNPSSVQNAVDGDSSTFAMLRNSANPDVDRPSITVEFLILVPKPSAVRRELENECLRNAEPVPLVQASFTVWVHVSASL